MPPHPKRKLSKGRRARRRAHDSLPATHLVSCPQCGSMRLPHHVCPDCGAYKGETVLEIEGEKKS